MDRNLDDVLDQRHVLPEIEILEDHAELGADALDLLAVGGNGVAMTVGLHPDLLAIDANEPAGRVLQAIDAAQECRLARAAAADDGDDLAVACRQRNALEHMEFAESFMQVLDMDGFGGVVLRRVLQGGGRALRYHLCGAS